MLVKPLCEAWASVSGFIVIMSLIKIVGMQVGLPFLEKEACPCNSWCYGKPSWRLLRNEPDVLECFTTRGNFWNSLACYFQTQVLISILLTSLAFFSKSVCVENIVSTSGLRVHKHPPRFLNLSLSNKQFLDFPRQYS